MRSHLFSLHPSIWEIVENEMHFDSTINLVFINEQIHKNAHATTVLLASLCIDEYNKVSGLDNAKQIWDTLKISHERNDATMITKMELVEGELGRFAMIRGEEPTQTCNRLKTLVNKIRSYGSTRWTDHDVVRLMLRSFIVIDPHRENPKYTKMTPEEILEKFMSGRMMVKEARYMDDALNGPLPVYEPQLIALKATSSREALPSKVAQVEAVGLNEDKMALIIKRFKATLKGRKEYPNKNKSRGKRSCFKCGKTGHVIAQCPDNDSDQAQEKHGKKEKKKNYRKVKGEAHLGKGWDSDYSSSDSYDEGLATAAFDKSSLFPNELHMCLMAKEKKVCIRDTPKYTSSSDEESSDDEVDYTDLFKGLDRSKVDKINELIDALNEKDRLLEKQEDILYEQHDKFISVQKSLALEIKINEMLSSKLSTCHESISSLKNLNDELNDKLEKVTSSCVEHVVICNRCKDVDFDKHAATIAKLNNDVASLNDQLKTCKNDYEKLKFAKDSYTVGRHPSIKDGLCFQKETKNLTSQRTSDLNKGKGKAPMASSSYSLHDQKDHAYLYTHVKKISHHDRSNDHVVLLVYHISHALVASSSTYAYGSNRPRCNHAVSHAPRKVCNGPTTIYHACNTSFVLSCKNVKVVARKLGSKCKGDKTCIWVPKFVVTNLVGPNKSWVSKTQA
jgi:hypothetical protein